MQVMLAHAMAHATAFSTAVGSAVLHFLWQGILVAGVAWIAIAFTESRSASARYAIACASLLACFVLFVGTVVVSYDVDVADEVIDGRADATDISLNALRVDGFQQLRSGGGLRGDMFSDAPGALLPERPKSATREASEADVGVSSGRSPALSRLNVRAAILPAAWFWCIGIVVAVLRFTLQYRAVRRIRRNSAGNVDVRLAQMFEALTRRMGLRKRVDLRQSDAADVPMVIGWLSPIVVFPTLALTSLTPVQLRAVVAHELAHIRRLDHLVNGIQTVIEISLFFHPAIWWIGRTIRHERELCCDDIALQATGHPLIFAQALEKLETLRATPGQVALAANGGSLMQRIERILGINASRTPSPRVWPVAAGLVAVLSLAATGLAHSALMTESIEKPDRDRTSSPVEIELHADDAFGHGDGGENFDRRGYDNDDQYDHREFDDRYAEEREIAEGIFGLGVDVGKGELSRRDAMAKIRSELGSADLDDETKEAISYVLKRGIAVGKGRLSADDAWDDIEDLLESRHEHEHDGHDDNFDDELDGDDGDDGDDREAIASALLELGQAIGAEELSWRQAWSKIGEEVDSDDLSEADRQIIAFVLRLGIAIEVGDITEEVAWRLLGDLGRNDSARGHGHGYGDENDGHGDADDREEIISDLLDAGMAIEAGEVSHRGAWETIRDELDWDELSREDRQAIRYVVNLGAEIEAGEISHDEAWSEIQEKFGDDHLDEHYDGDDYEEEDEDEEEVEEKVEEYRELIEGILELGAEINAGEVSVRKAWRMIRRELDVEELNDEDTRMIEFILHLGGQIEAGELDEKEAWESIESAMRDRAHDHDDDDDDHDHDHDHDDDDDHDHDDHDHDDE